MNLRVVSCPLKLARQMDDQRNGQVVLALAALDAAGRGEGVTRRSILEGLARRVSPGESPNFAAGILSNTQERGLYLRSEGSQDASFACIASCCLGMTT